MLDESYKKYLDSLINSPENLISEKEKDEEKDYLKNRSLELREIIISLASSYGYTIPVDYVRDLNEVEGYLQKLGYSHHTVYTV